MSGGTLTDSGCCPLYYILDWAKQIERENPLLAEMLRDEYVMLEKYDYYMSGDSSKEDAEKVWAEFSERWLKGNLTEAVETVLKRMALSMRTGVRHPHKAEW